MCSRFHVTKLIRCDRTCQQLITIINKDKSFSPDNFKEPVFSSKFLFERKLSKRFT